MLGIDASLGCHLAVLDGLLESLISTLVIGVLSIALLGAAIAMMEHFTPFSIRKELEEDHNNAVAIVMAAVIIGVALVIAAVAKG